jgi:hypothetical protein
VGPVGVMIESEDEEGRAERWCSMILPPLECTLCSGAGLDRATQQEPVQLEKASALGPREMIGRMWTRLPNLSAHA